jgi:acyl-CoA synthetase (NDP forming)
MFYPKSVAVIGASRDEKREWDQGWVGMLLRFGYPGRIYPVNPNASEILGLRAYPSIKDIPHSVEYAILAVPAPAVPALLAECVSACVRFVHIFTAGFAETGTEEGRRLQQAITEIVNNTSTRVIGPNCMGIYCPASGLTFDIRLSKKLGSVGLVSQTGIGARRLCFLANQKGVRFSKVVSYGNAVDLDAPDFLDYLGQDPETRCILCYIEGVRHARQLLKTVRECVETKPVVILKAGLTEGGSGAAASHTASLTGSREAWEAFFKQSGAIRVETLEEIVDQSVALLYTPPLTGHRVGIVGRGGGFGVIATDLCENAGLLVPEHCSETKRQLEQIIPAYAGSSVRNPVEIGLGRSGISKDYSNALKIIASDPEIDFLMTYIDPETYRHYGGLGDWSSELATAISNVIRSTHKPIIAIIPEGHTAEMFSEITETRQKLLDAKLPTFSSWEAAIRAVSKLIRYYEFVSRNNVSNPSEYRTY